MEPGLTSGFSDAETLILASVGLGAGALEHRLVRLTPSKAGVAVYSIVGSLRAPQGAR